MEYKLNLGCWGNVFAVPTAAVDKYIKTSSGDNLKILLFFLRHAEEDIQTASAAQKLGLTEDQLIDGLEFWIQQGIFAKQDGLLAPAQGNPDHGVQTTDKHSNISALNRTPIFVPKEIASTVRGSDKADLLFKYCEKLYGRTLKHNEQNTLMIILEDACMPVEVAMLMVEYCFSVGKATPAYMRTLALDWTERGINTIERAEVQILELKNLHETEGRLRTMFQMNSAFSKNQREFINTWVNKYGFSDEMIDAAYQITLDGAGKLSFPYMDKVLGEWHDKGIMSPEQIPERLKEKANTNKTSSSSFDINEIQRLIKERRKK